MNFAKMRSIQEGNELRNSCVPSYPLRPHSPLPLPCPKGLVNFINPVPLIYFSPSPPLPIVFPGSRAACVVPALKKGHSVSTCTQLPPGACVTPRVTGPQRRLWVKDHDFFIYTLVAKVDMGGGGKGWSGGMVRKR